MCGICGIVDVNKRTVSEEAVRKMTLALSHRGPDDEGIYSSEGVCLGHRRLSIIDLSCAARQPLSNEDKTVWVVLNGEIYNYRSLRVMLEGKGHKFTSNSDTEVIAHLYEEEGKDCVKAMLGMFAFAVWDKRKDLLLLARDRLGKKPLLYSRVKENFCFASEFSSLLKSGLIKKELEPKSLDSYLTLGYVPAPFTIYKDVFKLMPAHRLILEKGKLTLDRYWQIDYERKIKITEEEARDELLRLLSDAVKIRLYSDVPLGAFLSGGLDSSMVVGTMSRLSGRKVQTFSIGFDDVRYNELRYARDIAGRFGTDHKEFIVRPNALEVLPELIERYGEPYADSSAVPTYYVSKLSRQFVTVVLNGDGGDELFAGYERYQAMLFSEKFAGIPRLARDAITFLSLGVIPPSGGEKNKISRVRRFFEAAGLPLHKRYLKWVGVFDDDFKNKLYSPEFMSQTGSSSADDSFKEYLADTRLSLLDRLLKLDTRTYLPDDLLVKVDIASMANALEARSPFLDHRLVEFAASLPSGLKLRGGTKKYILKKAAEKLLPAENIHRPKQGFGVPVGDWFRGELKDYLRDNLLDERALKRGYFKASAVREMIGLHLAGKRDYGRQLWALLVLELWHRRFMEGE